MFYKWPIFLVSVGLFAAGEQQPWKDKTVPEWTQEDAQQLLNASPWVRSVTPAIDRSAQNQPRRSPVTFGGIPGLGGGRRGGYGYPGGGYPGGRPNTQDTYSEPPKLALRWESALPVREAELKARDNDAPTLDPDHYAIAVYGVPARFANGDSKTLADQFKKQAAIKRDGKKDLKPSSVEVLQRDNGPVIVYLFPRTKEITSEDRRIEFDAKIGRLDLSESFYTEDMFYQNKLEL